MGRGTKTIVAGNGLDRRVIGHYETPVPVAEFIAAELLRLNPRGTSVLDPCVGTGTLLQPFREKDVFTTGMDIVDWRNKPVDKFVEGDFLRAFYDSTGLWGSDRFSEFDYFVLNPPYNCHESDYVRSNKNWLSDAFPDVGVANMYAMFISAAIHSARPGALFGILTLDSFMTARLHEPLRQLIIESCIVHTIALCPRDLFRAQKADVRTCVLILEKKDDDKSSLPIVATLDRVACSDEFFRRIKSPLETTTFENISLPDKRDRSEFVVGAPAEILDIFKRPRLGELFSCITGISTGSDAKYLKRESAEGFTVPFYKNPASHRFWMDPNAFLIDHYLEESQAVSNFMVRNKSAYARAGISCSSMGLRFGAVYRPAGAAFGVNPNVMCSAEDIWWLLGLLNSSLITFIVRGVLLRTNMVTSGYISRLPIPDLDDATRSIIAEEAYKAYRDRARGSELSVVRNSIDDAIGKYLDFSDDTLNKIETFNANIETSV